MRGIDLDDAPEFQLLTAREQRTIKRILKVNHAGEYGAIRIYQAQVWIARLRFPEMVGFLEETLGHEVEHCQLFSSAMKSRETRPCRIMSLWGNGGFILGAVTALMGRKSIWVCTSAVETTVHKHLCDQLAFLEGKDSALLESLQSIQAEELSHLETANAHLSSAEVNGGLLRGLITNVTEILIWLSTWGDSSRMARELSQD